MAAWKKLLTSGDVVNADISGSADIHYDKIDFDNSIAYADIGQGEVNSGTIANGAVDLVHMSSESVDEDNLKVSNGPTNGYFLSAQSGNAGGMTWAAIAGDIEAVTAGDGLSGGGSSGSVTVTLDLNELGTETTIADADFIAMVDATDNGSQKITFENLEDAIFASISGDIAIAEDGAATIQANSVALTTDTTGNYVGTLTGGTGITSTGATSGEGITHSISIDSTQAITNISGDLTIAGDLYVNGASSSIDVQTLTVEDKTIQVANGAGSTTAADGSGITVDTDETNEPTLLWYKDNGADTGFPLHWGITSRGDTSVIGIAGMHLEVTSGSPSGLDNVAGVFAYNSADGTMYFYDGS